MPQSTDPQPQLRREWLSRSLSCIGATALASAAAGQTETEPASWIDAHVHVWPKVGREFPLAPEFSPDIVQPSSFTPEELFGHCRPCGVGRIVLIQMNFFGFDNSYMLDAIARFPKVFSGVAVIDHDQPQVRATMASLRDRGVRGYRLYATPANVATWQTSPSIASMFRHGADLGQAMCMLADPESIPGIAALCREHPQTTVVIDHFARIGMRQPPSDQDLDALCGMAKLPNVFVKTSAFYALGSKRPPYRDLLPMIQRLLDAFGAERLMWGSDCPYQVAAPHTYEASIALVRDHLDGISAETRRHLLCGTAKRVFFS